MILEHAVLEVVPGHDRAFEEAFSRAKSVISAATGFRSLRLGRCIERASRYLLLVEWDELEDHTKGFRGSAAYEEWRVLLHHFYDPFPVVDHYDDIVAVPEGTVATNA
jgi:heme-degrading monooxygenase HmoA